VSKIHPYRPPFRWDILDELNVLLFFIGSAMIVEEKIE